VEGAAWLMWRSPSCDEREVRSQLGEECGGFFGTRPVGFVGFGCAMVQKDPKGTTSTRSSKIV
jgi:hypothetical protein